MLCQFCIAIIIVLHAVSEVFAKLGNVFSGSVVIGPSGSDSFGEWVYAFMVQVNPGGKGTRYSN